jgi:hypothetical protein
MFDILSPISNSGIPAKSNWRSHVHKLQQMCWLSHLFPCLPLWLHSDGYERRTLKVEVIHDDLIYPVEEDIGCGYQKNLGNYRTIRIK